MADAMTPKAVKLSDQISERSNQQQNSSYDDLASHQNEPNANKMNGDSNAAISLPAADSVSQVYIRIILCSVIIVYDSLSLIDRTIQVLNLDFFFAFRIRSHQLAC